MISDINTSNPKIVIMASAPEIICSKCGATYISRGKNDSGICKECQLQDLPLKGGPLNDQN